MGQQPARFLALTLWLGWLAACTPLPDPGRPDPGLPAGFQSPPEAFDSWLAASLAGDKEALRRCYWSGLSPEELSSYLATNLRLEAREFLRGAVWLDQRPVTLVEVTFRFQTAAGEISRGVMVRTREGWKLQSW